MLRYLVRTVGGPHEVLPSHTTEERTPMPSPFPGMDPYLEHPALWPGVHQGLITFMWTTLNAVLPPRYTASIGERLYVVQPERDIYPDVMVLERPAPHPVRQMTEGTAVAIDPPWVLTIEPVEIREVFIEILATGAEDQVVTVIEVLSPANKAPGSSGRQLYLTRQREVFESQTHLIEIDFLRRGEHTIAVPREELRRRGPWDYLICLHRGGQGKRYEVWATTVRQRLPRICVPLAHGDPDLALDVQAIFNRLYDEGGYARRIDYRHAPPAPLAGDDATWAGALLHERGWQE